MKKPDTHIKSIVVALASAGLTTLPAITFANPTGGNVVAGNVTIQQESATKLGITQTSDKAIIDWQKYSIGANEHVQYYQPSASSVSLNRVVGQDPTQILGRLTANGQVFLVNPNGIYFGKNAQIDVAGLVATTHNIRNEDFLAGKYNFNIPGKPNAAVINEGTIRIADTGIAAFVAPSVANRGVIAAKLGKVVLASANGFTLDFTGDQLLSFMVGDEVAQTAFDIEGNQLTSFVESSGKIEAQGGYVLLTAKAAETAIHGVINHSGAIEATTVGQQNGEIILHAGKGSLVVSGTLDASAPNGGDGGFIETSGGDVDIAPTAKITTTSSMGNTGKWLIDPTDYVVQASGGNISGAQLSSYLNANNVEIQTLSTGSGLGNINIYDAVTWTSLNKLTLTAHRDINITQAVNASGGGSIKLRADSLGSGTGQVNFSGSGQLYVTNGAAVSIFYNPSSYTGSEKSDTTGNPYSAEVTRTNGATLIAYMLVNNVTQLQAMKDRPSGYYALSKDIYADGTNGSLNTATWNGGKGFIPVGTNAQTFSGRFFGDDHKIIGLHINDNMLLNAGLFGVIGANGRISHVGLESATVTGGGDAGILAGQNFGNITKAYAIGSVIGNSAGGLTGRNLGTIAQAFSSGSVTGLLGGSVGGLTSNNSGVISNSFSTSTVSLTFDDCGPLCQIGAAGALVAVNMGGGSITNSYATGLLTLVGTASPTSNGLMGMGIDFGTTTSSYWNTQTTGQATSPGGTGKTTAQMTQQVTFAGWDFGNIWNIDEGAGFPFLKWSNLVFNDPRVVLTPTSGGSSTSEGNRVSQVADICSLAPVVCSPETAHSSSRSNSEGTSVNTVHSGPTYSEPAGPPILALAGSKAAGLCASYPYACSSNENGERQIGSTKLYNMLLKIDESKSRNEEILANPDFMAAATSTFLTPEALRLALDSVRIYMIIAARLQTESLLDQEQSRLEEQQRVLKGSVLNLLANEKSNFLLALVSKLLEHTEHSEYLAAQVALQVGNYRMPHVPVAGGGLFSHHFHTETGHMALELFQNAAGLKNIRLLEMYQVPSQGGKRG